MPGVLGRHIEQPALFAPLRMMQTARTTAFGGEPPPHHLGVGKLNRHIHLTRNVGGLIVIAFYKARDELSLIHIEAFVQDELARALNSSLSHHENAGTGNGLLTVKAYKIEVDARGKHDLLSIVQAVDDLEPTLDAPRASKSSEAAASAMSTLSSFVSSRR